MVLPTWFSIVAGLAAAIAGGMACLLFVRRRTSSAHRSLAVLLGMTAVAQLANAAGLLDEAHAPLWRATAMVAELLQPTALFYVGLAFLNPAERNGDTSALWRARIVGCVGLFLAGFVITGQDFEWQVFEDNQAAIT